MPELDSIQTINALVDYIAQTHGSREIFVWRDRETRRSVSYIHFAQETRALAAALENIVPPDRNIAILGENSYQWLLCWFAVICAGRTAVPLDPQLPAAEMTVLLQKSDAALLLCSEGFADYLPEFQHIICMRDIPALMKPYTSTANWPCEPKPKTTASIVFTSGTTGQPKGVILSHRNFLSDALSGCRCMDLEHHVMLSVLPFYHTLSLTPGMLAQLPGGSTICICKGIKHLLKDLEVFQPEYTVVVPLMAEGMYQRIWETARKQKKEKLLRFLLSFSDTMLRLGIDLRRQLFKSVLAAFGGKLEWMLSGGAPISEECVSGFLRFGIEVLPAYGVTECAPGVALNRRGACKGQSVGQLLDCNEVKAVDGELLVRGDNVSDGYYRDEAATSEAFTGGWHKTGDLGYIDEDGYLYITGRKKNLIILSNGENVSPEYLEQKLLAIPLVQEALVYELDGEIAAELFLDEVVPDAASQLESALLALNRQLPVYQRITRTVLRDTEFPKTTTKKIKRK